MADPVSSPPIVLRVALVVVGLGLWFLTQRLLRYRPDGSGILGDGLHTLTARLNNFLLATPRWADRLLIVSSLGIDLLGSFVLAYSIFGPSVRPFAGLMTAQLMAEGKDKLSIIQRQKGLPDFAPPARSTICTSRSASGSRSIC